MLNRISTTKGKVMKPIPFLLAVVFLTFGATANAEPECFEVVNTMPDHDSDLADAPGQYQLSKYGYRNICEVLVPKHFPKERDGGADRSVECTDDEIIRCIKIATAEQFPIRDSWDGVNYITYLDGGVNARVADPGCVITDDNPATPDTGCSYQVTYTQCQDIAEDYDRRNASRPVYVPPPSSGGSGSGGGGGGSNQPPRIEAKIDDQVVDVDEPLELDVYKNFYDRDSMVYIVESANEKVATVDVDDRIVTVSGHSRGAVEVSVSAVESRYRNDLDNPRIAEKMTTQTFSVRVNGPAVVPLMPQAGSDQDGFVRIINHSSEGGEVEITAIDDSGAIVGKTAVQVGNGITYFNADDLEFGNPDKGMDEGVGSGTGDWRVSLRSDKSLDYEVLSYIRSSDGFLTSMHDLVEGEDGNIYNLSFFNPGSNLNQKSLVRLINEKAESVDVQIQGTDDLGEVSEVVSSTMPSNGTLTLSAYDLENGIGVDGSLGDGDGKWRLKISASSEILVMNIMESTAGYMTNLSTVPKYIDGDAKSIIPVFPSSMNAMGREGFVRMINNSEEAGVVSVMGSNGADTKTVEFNIEPKMAVHFNSTHFESSSEKDWNLVFDSELDLDISAYVRTQDGFLTNMHDVVPSFGTMHHVATFNPGKNPNQVSRLHIMNTGEEKALIQVSGMDDAGEMSEKTAFYLPAGETLVYSALELENGVDGQFNGIGDGTGKWCLHVESDQAVFVTNLMDSPTGHMTNLSTAPDSKTN